MTDPRPPEMSCEEIVATISDYLEGRMAAGEAARFEAHLAGCPYCVTYVEQMRMTIRTLGRIETEALSATTRRDLLSSFRELRER